MIVSSRTILWLQTAAWNNKVTFLYRGGAYRSQTGFCNGEIFSFLDLRQDEAVQLVFLTVYRDGMSEARQQRRQGEQRRDKKGDKRRHDVAAGLQLAAVEKIDSASQHDRYDKSKNDFSDPRCEKARRLLGIGG